jgi:hypothetical protein
VSTTDGDTATGRLHELYAYYRQHPVKSAAGHSYLSSAPRATVSVPEALVDLDIVDHIQASLREVVDDALAANPEAGPLPARVEGVYRWYVEHTINAPEAVQQRRDTVIYRQGLEHAIAMGNTKVVRPHRCPACRTFSLMWPRAQGAERAVCTNRRCLDAEGMTCTWTLARLAYEHVAAQKNHGRASAT